MEPLRIHTAIHSRYRVFDASGQLPFSIVFGLCRHAQDDTDPRPIVLQTKHSILDVPYAIAHRLLTLSEQQEGSEPDTEVCLANQLKNIDADSENGTRVTLESPIGRKEHWRNSFTVYQYRIDPKSELALVLQPGKKYKIKLTSRDLGVTSWVYSDSAHPSPSNQESTTPTSEIRKLVNLKTYAGTAGFGVVSTLPYPPKTHMNMELVSHDESNSGAVLLSMTVTNTGSQPINVQTHGRQHFLLPWGPFQPEEYTNGNSRSIIIDSIWPEPSSSLRIINTATGDAVCEPGKPGPCYGVYYVEKVDPRPELQSLVTLWPNQPFVKRVDITKLVRDLVDGKYRIEIVPREAWWCFGSREEISDGEDGRVARRFWTELLPPLVLDTNDTVDLQIKDGGLVG
ncbi:hypothetical protein F5Y16DRAFT_392628 [Xylariaceae sp. FL0255]|nr:hypothetical protein F5Y16DRAFT_392628 [Xylariaceae sp. FL0255]